MERLGLCICVLLAIPEILGNNNEDNPGVIATESVVELLCSNTFANPEPSSGNATVSLTRFRVNLPAERENETDFILHWRQRHRGTTIYGNQPWRVPEMKGEEAKSPCTVDGKGARCTGRSFSISNLAFNLDYQFRVAVDNEQMHSDWISLPDKMPAVHSAPNELKIRSVEYGVRDVTEVVNVEWKSNSRVPSCFYHLSVERQIPPEHNASDIIVTEEMAYSLERLHFGANYTVKLRAISTLDVVGRIESEATELSFSLKSCQEVHGHNMSLCGLSAVVNLLTRSPDGIEDDGISILAPHRKRKTYLEMLKNRTGVVLACCALIALLTSIAVVSVLLWYRAAGRGHRITNEIDSISTNEVKDQLSLNRLYFLTKTAVSKKKRAADGEVTLLTDNLSLVDEGQFGVVYRGSSNLMLNGIHTTSTVAVKFARADNEFSSVSYLKEEAAIMRRLCLRGCHPNIVAYYGMTMNDQLGYGIVMEWCEGGSLKKHLESLRPHLQARVLPIGGGDSGLGSSPIDNLYEPSALFEVPLVLSDYCRQIADGMTFVASQGIVHRDLAARNLLIVDSPAVVPPPISMLARHRSPQQQPALTSMMGRRLKIADFGLARPIGHYYQRQSAADTALRMRRPVPIRWRAPETLLMFTDGDVTLRPEGKPLRKPRWCFDLHYEIMSSCWNLIQEKRPCFADLSLQLRLPNQLASENPTAVA